MLQDVIRMTYDVALCHPDEITKLIPKSSGWLSNWQYLIRLTYGQCHSDDIRSFPKSSGWHNVSWTLCHPDEIPPWPYLIRMTYDQCRYHPDDVVLCHPDEITNLIRKSSGWLSYSQYPTGWLMADALCHPDDLTGVGISYGWVTTNSLSHPDYIPFHPDDLMRLVSHPDESRQCYYITRMRYVFFLKSSGRDSKFRFSTPRGGPSALP